MDIVVAVWLIFGAFILGANKAKTMLKNLTRLSMHVIGYVVQVVCVGSIEKTFLVVARRSCSRHQRNRTPCPYQWGQPATDCRCAQWCGMAAQPHTRCCECADPCAEGPSGLSATRCTPTHHRHLSECTPQHTRGPPASGAGFRECRPVERRYAGLVEPALSHRTSELVIVVL